MYYILLLTVFGLTFHQGNAQVTEAKCIIVAADSARSQPVSGVIRLRQETNGQVVIGVNLAGLNANDGVIQHGFHIHTTPDISAQCANVGAHYNPENKNHGAPTDLVRHVGDLGNVDEQNDNGIVQQVLVDQKIALTDTLPGRYNVMGKPIVVHAGTDDLGRGGAASSLTTGNAGSKIGCCIITATTSSDYRQARCSLKVGDPVGGQNLQGDITARQLTPGGMVDYTLDIRGFSTTDNHRDHGFHVHETGDITNQCRAAGSHFNPGHTTHGGPSILVRHAGDLGNILEDNFGNVKTTLYDAVSSLIGINSIAGKAIVVHEKRDDLGQGGNTESSTTGNAGRRLACCVISAPSEPVSSAPQVSNLSILSFIAIGLFIVYRQLDL